MLSHFTDKIPSALRSIGHQYPGVVHYILGPCEHWGPVSVQPSASWSSTYCVALGGSHLRSRPSFTLVKDQRMPLPTLLGTSAHLGLGIIEDVGWLLAEAGYHVLDGRGGAANLLCQSSCLQLSPVLGDDSSGGQHGATLEEKADSGMTVEISCSLLSPDTSGYTRAPHPSACPGAPEPFPEKPTGIWARAAPYPQHPCHRERGSSE